MARTPPRFQCRHIHIAGNRCGSPSLRTQNFCYYHTTARPAPRIPDNPPNHPRDEAFDLPPIEDRASIQLAISEVVRRLATNRIDPKRAGLLIYALQAATGALPREARRTGSPQAAESTPVDPVEQVDSIVVDETLGPLAPMTRFVSPEEREFRNRKPTLADILLAGLRTTSSQPCANCKLTPKEARLKAESERPGRRDPCGPEVNRPKPQQPEVVPTVQAVAENLGAPCQTARPSDRGVLSTPTTTVSAPHLAPEMWEQRHKSRRRHSLPQGTKTTEERKGREGKAAKEGWARGLRSHPWR